MDAHVYLMYFEIEKSSNIFDLMISMWLYVLTL